jgi:hypothetical protein
MVPRLPARRHQLLDDAGGQNHGPWRRSRSAGGQRRQYRRVGRTEHVESYRVVVIATEVKSLS